MSRRTTAIQHGAPRERILKVAQDLFYRQGYRATGINEVIRKSGVAKATFYSHFRTKDDLGLAYLQEAMQAEITHVERFIASAEGPLERFLAVVRSLEPFLRENHCRGCPFLNMASEIPDPDSPMRVVGQEVYDYVRRRVRTLSEELIASDPDRYGHLDADGLAGEYMVAVAGALELAEIYNAMWPLQDAERAIQRLIGQEEAG